MSQPVIVPIDFTVDQVGKTVKATKKRFIWKFSINGHKQEIVCDMSLISGKIKLTLNGRILKSSELIEGYVFQHSFTLQGCSCIILQLGDNVQFRISNKAFLHLLNQERTKKEFKTEEDQQIQDFVYDKGNTPSEQKKVVLSIGGMDMKKKKNNIESEDWKKMCGAQSSIPNYFNRSEEVEGIPEVTTKHMKVEDLKTSLGVNLLNEEQGKGVGISNLSSIEEKTEEKSATNLMEDFNTMQQMFATGMYNVCTAENNENQTSETPQDFNTMQSLFSTQGPKMTPHLVNQSKVTVSEDPQEFSTMQSLFKTNNVNMSKIPQQSMDPNQQSVDLNDFSTMQNIFATVNPQKMPQNISQIQNIPNESDFTTMQSMFKTINISPIQSKEESIQGSQLPNPSDFSTMQNLFTTQKLDMSKMPKMNQNPDALADIQNINNINMNDFNTMQSLFKTNANVEKIQKPQEFMKSDENNLL